ncbi:hypothetical protein OJF2_51120 [Aquisphaera giovannonii]|uniref:Uncharacterized protein n=1 Tax=Aquisphaera giovannonii TaxID=406548 RepID=A0A5B9W7H3_9BACT|nr:hypothetical protein [Aquisphaera giovannonii]QEH36528.1 hypothetical protein OJF2_51120 [Aquisphaera giovannonii]
MPVSLKRIRQSGALIFLHTCEVCGAAASFGFGVSMRLALNALEAGDKASAKLHLGQWFCREHRPETAADTSA